MDDAAAQVEESPSAPPVSKPTRSVVYKQAGDKALRMFIFEPPGFRPSDRRPCFLAIHGGGWMGGAPWMMYEPASYFAGRGMVGISIEYRLHNRETPVADCVRDGRSAMRWLRSQAAELGIDPDQIIACGASAGGHLAAGTVLFEGIDEAGEDTSVSSRPAALVLFCPVLDTSEEGYGFAKVGAQWRELSAIERMRAGVPPAILFHSKADAVVPYKGAVRFVEVMKKAGNTCELVTYEQGAHSFMIHDPVVLAGALAKVMDFLRPLGIKATNE